MDTKTNILSALLLAICMTSFVSASVGYTSSSLPHIDSPTPALCSATCSGNSSFNQTLSDLLYWRLDGTNDPPSASWQMGARELFFQTSYINNLGLNEMNIRNWSTLNIKNVDNDFGISLAPQFLGGLDLIGGSFPVRVTSSDNFTYNGVQVCTATNGVCPDTIPSFSNIAYLNNSETQSGRMYFQNTTLNLNASGRFVTTVIAAPNVQNTTWIIPSGASDTFVGASTLSSSVATAATIVDNTAVNNASKVTITNLKYILIGGNVVTVSGRFTFNSSVIGVISKVGLTVPLASSFLVPEGCSGTAASSKPITQFAEIYGVGSDPGAYCLVEFNATTLGQQTWSYIYQYRIDASIG